MHEESTVIRDERDNDPGLTLVPQSPLDWLIASAMLLLVILSVGGFYWYTSATLGTPTAQSAHSSQSASRYRADKAQSNRAQVPQSSTHSSDRAGDVQMSGKYRVGPDGKLLRPQDAPVPPLPVKPAEIMLEGSEGVIALRQHLVDLIHYMWMTGDTTPFDAISQDSCTWCDAVVDDVRKVYDEGGWAENLAIDVVSVREPMPSPTHEGLWITGVKIHLSPAKAYENGKLVNKRSSNVAITFAAEYTQDGWKIFGGKAEEVE